jgi:hypothetical protein
MLDWLKSRHRSKERTGPVRYVQSQNGNLATEFTKLRQDVRQLSWANEGLGHLTFQSLYLTVGEAPDASNIWIGNEESVTSLHSGIKHLRMASLNNEITMKTCIVKSLAQRHSTSSPQ